MNIDINNKYYYTYGDTPEIKERTRERLAEIIALGMTEVGEAQFGIKGIMSGLYIERVWSFDERQWEGYIDWVKKLKSKHETTEPIKEIERTFSNDIEAYILLHERAKKEFDKTFLRLFEIKKEDEHE